jgi:CSLREA domain-containing protein
MFNFGIATVSNSTFQSNSVSGGTGTGGGIFNRSTLTLRNSTLSGNAAQQGGGIHNSSTGRLTVDKSTLSSNSAADGGGIYNRDSAEVTVANSTLTGNTATVQGGGILNIDPATLTLIHSTLTGNTASVIGGGLINNGSATIANSIIANSTGGDCLPGRPPDINHTLVEDGGCSVTNGVNNNKTGDPKLGPLSNNGGATLTHALLTGSPAIGAANNSLCAAAPINRFDQRDLLRDAACDMGAYEVDAVPTAVEMVVISAEPNPTPTPLLSIAAFMLLTLTVSLTVKLGTVRVPHFRFVALILLTLLLCHMPLAYAEPSSTITVNSALDNATADGQCTLREAIANANADAQVGSADCAAGSGSDTILFSFGGTPTTLTLNPALGAFPQLFLG